MAKDRLHDATESPIFICGMTALDPDDLFYNICLCDPSLDCDTHIEADVYTSRIMPERIELCCHCAGEFDSPLELNSNLKAPEGPYSMVLPVCKVCLENGCSIIVRAAGQNAEAKQAKIDAAAAMETGRKERDVAEAVANAIETPAATTIATTAATSGANPDASSAPKPKNKKRTSTRCVCLYQL